MIPNKRRRRKALTYGDFMTPTQYKRCIKILQHEPTIESIEELKQYLITNINNTLQKFNIDPDRLANEMFLNREKLIRNVPLIITAGNY